jgi:hypothetical protein
MIGFPQHRIVLPLVVLMIGGLLAPSVHRLQHAAQRADACAGDAVAAARCLGDAAAFADQSDAGAAHGSLCLLCATTYHYVAADSPEVHPEIVPAIASPAPAPGAHVATPQIRFIRGPPARSC